MNYKTDIQNSKTEMVDLKIEIPKLISKILNPQPDLGVCSIGTAGWHYKDWEIIFYPQNKGKTFDKLEFYSQFFDCVEVDSTFYNFFSPEKVRDWVNRVNANKRFMFSVKMNNLFTHKQVFSADDVKTMRSFLDEFTASGKFESVLLQFPYHFICNSENKQYLFLLSKIFGSYKLVAELRHLSWHNPLTYNFLEESKLHLCNIDQPRVLDNVPFTSTVLGKYAYVRLHGRNENAWLKNSNDGKFDYLYSNSELEKILKRIEELRKQSDKVYIILNNHPIGKAAVNAFSLISMMRNGRRVPIPEQTLYFYPNLLPIAAKVDSYQLPIFS
jgi:uncharacterized protein YecE (DUF72 family)